MNLSTGMTYTEKQAVGYAGFRSPVSIEYYLYAILRTIRKGAADKESDAKKVKAIEAEMEEARRVLVSCGVDTAAAKDLLNHRLNHLALQPEMQDSAPYLKKAECAAGQRAVKVGS